MEQQAETGNSVWPLGKYLILAELGRGGMAEVYLAMARSAAGVNKLVVLKLLRPHLAEDPEFFEMFLAEARLAARLNHPNVVQTYEISQEGARSCIAMEYLEGRTLQEVEHATRTAAIPINVMLRILADTLAGLHYAHELCDMDGHRLDLVHRDVSPQNVFVTYDGHVKVLDFGIAKAANSGSRTRTGVFKGKMRYTAPERLSGDDADRRSDVFSVGVMLWQSLTGRKFWAGLNDLAIVTRLASSAPIPTPRQLDATVDPRLDAICMKALALAPEDRFQTAAEFQDAIEDYLAAQSTQATTRTMAKFMAERFGEERSQFQRTVDEQMRVAASLPQDPSGDSMSRLRLSGTNGVPVLGQPYASSGGFATSGAQPIPLGSTGSLSISNNSISAMRAAPGGLGVSMASGPISLASSSSALSGSSASQEAMAAAPPARDRRGTIVLVLLGIAAIFGGGFALARSDQRATTKSAEAAQPKGSPSPVAAGTAQSAAAVAAASDPTSSVHGEVPTTAHGDMAGSSASFGSSPRAPAPGSHAAPPAPTAASHVWSPPPKKAAPQASAEAPKAPASTKPAEAKPDCASPYYVDDQGVKKIRSECL